MRPCWTPFSPPCLPMRSGPPYLDNDGRRKSAPMGERPMKRSLLLAACAAISMSAASVQAAPPAHVTAAVANPDRPAADKERDAARKPAEMLEFAGVKQGDVVVELIPG